MKTVDRSVMRIWIGRVALFVVAALDENVRRRLFAGAAFAFCASLLTAAAWAKPDPRGLGTHEQLGLPPCGMPMRWGLPCPTCGMCTAFAHAVRGELGSALRAQPAGLALALATVAGAVLSAATLATGKDYPAAWRTLPSTAIVWVAVGVFLGAWGYKAAVMWASHVAP